MAVDDLDADGSMNQPGRPKVTARCVTPQSWQPTQFNPKFTFFLKEFSK
jgi:hypothetical protein